MSPNESYDLIFKHDENINIQAVLSGTFVPFNAYYVLRSEPTWNKPYTRG